LQLFNQALAFGFDCSPLRDITKDDAGSQLPLGTLKDNRRNLCREERAVLASRPQFPVSPAGSLSLGD
jgi:hypothetical protein